jgi:hypothetical protein
MGGANKSFQAEDQVFFGSCSEFLTDLFRVEVPVAALYKCPGSVSPGYIPVILDMRKKAGLQPAGGSFGIAYMKNRVIHGNSASKEQPKYGK